MSFRAAFFALGLVLFLPFASSHAELAKYYIPPQQFNAAFQIMDMGYSNLFGLFKSATGSFSYDDSAKSIGHVRIALDSGSLMTANGGDARDLAALFEPRKYPEISFLALTDSSFKDGKADIKGTLNAHGVSKPFTMEATLNHSGKKSGDDDARAIGLSLRGSFKRADFDMGEPPEVPGRFGDSITLMLEMQAIRQ